MKINLLVSGTLYASQSAYSALRFCQAANAAGHTISQVFFYQDGVTQANRLSMPLDDEFNALDQWVKFAEQNAVPLVICISAGERRGVMSDAQAAEYQLASGNAHPAFSVAGLGALHDASLDSDRTVTFK
ncbi:MAG: tRNA 2-thiouridine synthesizing protein D [Arenicella sp.]|jgi:tRNA 2-thiouridine synthesizing protein D